jgi:acyl carrier protein phosphodiesterase
MNYLSDRELFENHLEFQDEYRRIRARPLSPADITRLTNQIEHRMRALGIPAQYVGIKGIPGTNGKGFDLNIKDPGGNVRTRGIAIGAGVLKKIKGWGTWNRASLKTRIDAVIAHEWAEFNGLTHRGARHTAYRTKLPISPEARELLRDQKDRGAPEMADEYDGEAIERSFQPTRPVSPWPKLLNQATQAIQNAITHLKSPQNLKAFDNALTSAEYLLNQTAREIQKVIADSPSVPRRSTVLRHLGNAWTRINAARSQARGTTNFGGRSFIDPAISLHGAIEQIRLARQAIGWKQS